MANLAKLRFTMAATLAVIIAVTTLAFTVILSYFDALSIGSLIFWVVAFNILQWLVAPYIVNFSYGVKPLQAGERPQLDAMIQRLSERSGIKAPKLMISSLRIPNAFAYGSPLTGNMVAVTDGLLADLDDDEVEAVIGHEVGHIVHRDVQIMMLASCLPSLFYMLSRMFLYSRSDSDDRDGNGLAVVGGISLVVYFALTLLNLGLSRQREYYADQHAKTVVDDGARKLSEGLAKISTGTYARTRGRSVGASSFKTLMIADPDPAAPDAADFGYATDSDLVDQVRNRRVSGWDSFMELFSTHPNIVKRLRALEE